jgi:hypothetical protein
MVTLILILIYQNGKVKGTVNWQTANKVGTYLETHMERFYKLLNILLIFA